jgi:hypothetical protein
MNLSHLSTNTPASEVSSESFNDGYNSNDSEVKSLDDILRNSPAANLLGLKESLPEEDDDVPNPDEASEEKEAQENDDESAKDLDEEESKDSEEEEKAEDDASTQNADYIYLKRGAN